MREGDGNSYTLSYALRYRVTVLYNRCGCVYGIKDCVRSLQAQTTAVQNEWKERE
jgi:hypothetical protein